MVADQPVQLTTSEWRGAAFRDRIALTLGSVVCLWLTMWLSGALRVPATPGCAGSLLQQNAWPVAMGAAWLSLLAGTAITSIIARRSHFDGGLFCACVGLAALSSQLGPSRYALFAAGSAGVYLVFAGELILVYMAIAVLWMILLRLPHAPLPAAAPLTGDGNPDEPLNQKFLATAAQTIITMVLIMLLCQSDAKTQTLASVGVASYLAALGAHHLVPARPSAFFWAGPALVGLIGYIGQYIGGNGLALGDPRGFFAPLARPLPIDYASLGTAGAMLGYWTSLRWHHERAEMDSTAES